MRPIFRYIFILFLIVLSAGATSAQGSYNENFNKGVTLYTAANYKDALQIWTEIYNTGYRSSSLDYNIGNAWFKLNDIPHAILFYERAYLLNPADENINYNLQIARTMIVDRFQEIPELFFVKWYNFISLFLSSNIWAKISIFSFILALLFLSLYIYSPRYRHKVTGFWMSVVFFTFMLGSLSFTIRNKSLVYDSHKAIITIPVVSGKSSPDNSGTDLFVLHEGTKVNIEDTVGDWLEIRLSDGNKGWIPVNSLNII
jgi:tetratricopeptide (TPR) repeat protein